jgi:hypothetical protein
MVFCEESDLWARYWESNVFCSCCRVRVLPQMQGRKAKRRGERRMWLDEPRTTTNRVIGLKESLDLETKKEKCV